MDQTQSGLRPSWIGKFRRAGEMDHKTDVGQAERAPSRFRYISTQQICECDKEMWMQLSQQSRGILHSLDPDVYPLDSLIEQLTTSPEVLCFLSPLPGAKREQETPQASDTKKPKPNNEGRPSAPKPAGAAPSAANWRKVPAGCQRKGTNGWRCLKFQWGMCNKQKEPNCKFGVHECFKCGAKRPYNQCEH